MAQGVRGALLNIINADNNTPEDASVLLSWTKEKRYILDVWY